MTTRMVHPKHGATTAYNAPEIEAFKKAGWSVQTGEEFAAVIAAKLGTPKSNDDGEEAQGEAAQKKKPGRKPKA